MPGGGMGTRVFETTAASNLASRDPATVLQAWRLWKVYDVPDADPAWILGRTTGMDLGSVLRVYPFVVESRYESRYVSIKQFLREMYRGAGLYHGHVGYSNRFATSDEQYYAVDFYWQPPRMLDSEEYIWFVLRNVYQPIDWYKADLIQLCGYRHMIDDRTMSSGRSMSAV